MYNIALYHMLTMSDRTQCYFIYQFHRTFYEWSHPDSQRRGWNEAPLYLNQRIHILPPPPARKYKNTHDYYSKHGDGFVTGHWDMAMQLDVKCSIVLEDRARMELASCMSRLL